MTSNTVGTKSHLQFALHPLIILTISISTPVLAQDTGPCCSGQDTGACCDLETGICQDEITRTECGVFTFGKDRLCANLDCVQVIAFQKLIPVQPEGLDADPYPPEVVIDGHTIYIPDIPIRLWFNVLYGDFAPLKLCGLQAVLDFNSFASGTGAPLQYPIENCVDSIHCAFAFGEFSDCARDGDAPNFTGTNTCRPAFINPDHPDADLHQWGLATTDTHTENMRFGMAATFGDTPHDDPGRPVYGGTLVLDVPAGAQGIYTIDLLPRPHLEMGTDINLSPNDDPLNTSISTSITPAIVSVSTGACCDSGLGSGGACVDNIHFSECVGIHTIWRPNTTCFDINCVEAFGACCNNLTGVCRDNVQQNECLVSDVWRRGSTCQEIECNQSLGACCNTRSGNCENTVNTECQGENHTWLGGESCNNQRCPDLRLPAVSQWGLLILVLLLMISIKIKFSRVTTIQ